MGKKTEAPEGEGTADKAFDENAQYWQQQIELRFSEMFELIQTMGGKTITDQRQGSRELSNAYNHLQELRHWLTLHLETTSKGE